MKKLLKTTALFAIMLSILVMGNAATSKAASNKATAAYQTFVKQLKAKEKPESIYTATVKSGEGEDILLISDCLTDKNNAFSAKLYQYVNNKVTYIGRIDARNSSEPLCKCGNYITYNSGTYDQHALIISNGKATEYQASTIEYVKKNISINQFKIEHNKRSMVSTRRVNRKKMQNGKFSCIINTKVKWIPIKFKKA